MLMMKTTTRRIRNSFLVGDPREAATSPRTRSIPIPTPIEGSNHHGTIQDVHQCKEIMTRTPPTMSVIADRINSTPTTRTASTGTGAATPTEEARHDGNQILDRVMTDIMMTIMIGIKKEKHKPVISAAKRVAATVSTVETKDSGQRPQLGEGREIMSIILEKVMIIRLLDQVPQPRSLSI